VVTCVRLNHLDAKLDPHALGVMDNNNWFLNNFVLTRLEML